MTSHLDKRVLQDLREALEERQAVGGRDSA